MRKWTYWPLCIHLLCSSEGLALYDGTAITQREHGLSCSMMKEKMKREGCCIPMQQIEITAQRSMSICGDSGEVQFSNNWNLNLLYDHLLS